MNKNKQQSIFEEWLEKHKGLLFKIIRSYATDPQNQDDLFQDICLQIYRSIPNFEARSAVSTWLYRISLNTAIKWSTKENRHHLNNQHIELVANVLEDTHDPLHNRLQWLYSEIHKLDEVDRSLTLLLLEGYSYKEIADIIGISANHIGVKLHRIKKNLTKASKKYDYGT